MSGLVLSTVGLFAALSLQTALAAPAEHPAEGQPLPPPRPMIAGYRYGAPAEWSRGNIVFPERLPAESELSARERYILRGTVSSPFPGGPRLQPWLLSVFKVVLIIEQREGRVPEVLDDQVLGRVFPNADPQRLSVYRNPLTGEWPRLNATALSPGDVYIRKLSREEMEHFARLNEHWRREWFGNDLASAVYYLRIHGERETIVAEFKWISTDLTRPPVRR